MAEMFIRGYLEKKDNIKDVNEDIFILGEIWSKYL